MFYVGKDNIALLSDFYHSRGVNVVVLPSKGIGTDGQIGSFTHCVTDAAVKSDWVIVADTDEFIYAPGHCTISSWLSDQPDGVSVHEFHDLRFGTAVGHCQQHTKEYVVLKRITESS